MKKTLTKAGAIGLAAATILTGLSFGPAAASAAPLRSETAAADTFKLAYKLPDGRWLSVGSVNGGTQSEVYATAAEAEAAAATYRYDSATRMVSSTMVDYCFDVTGWGGPNTLDATACDPRVATQKFTPTATGGFVSDARPGLFLNSSFAYSAALTYPVLGSGPEAEIVSGFRPFTGSLVSIDLHARTAKIEGRAAPLSTVIINDYQEADVDDDGIWSATVTGLSLGVSTLTLEQYEGTEKTAETTLDVDLAVQPVTATTTFDADRTKDAVLSGTAHPGATVIVEDASGKEIDRAPASSLDGSWDIEIPAPNLGGDYPVTIHQLIDNEADGEIGHTIAYGAAVAVTRPVPDADHAGGPLTMRGTGEARAELTVREQGHPDVIGSGNVLASQTWNLKTTDLDDSKHVLEVTQTGKGGNVTTSTITLNPDAVAPVTVTSPVSGTEFEPNTATRFTGTGEDGGIITLTPTNGAASATTTVANGTWSIDRYLGNGPYTFDVTQVAGGETSSVNGIVLTPKSVAPIDQDFGITSPTTGSAVTNQLVAFTGTGAAGTTVRLHTTNFASADITTVVKNDGTWSVNKWIGDGPYVMDITQEGRVEGAVRDFRLNNEVGINLPLAVTTPTAGDDVRSKVQTFTGTGRHGELVTIKATSPTGLAEVSGVVAKNGTWSINRFIGDGPYAFDVVQTKNGVESGAERDFRINQPAKREGVTGPLVVTGPTDGATFTANTQAAFTGTGTTGAVITVTPTAGAAVTTEVTEDGTWSVNKYLGDGPYTFTVTSTLDGLTETHPGTISLTPAP